MKMTFLLSRFLDGGIDTVLVRYVNGLAKEGHEVTFVIANGYGNLEVYKKIVSENVKFEYLVNEGCLTAISKKKLTRRLSSFEKFGEEAFCRPLRRLIQTWRMPKVLENQDIVIDMDCLAASFLKRVKCPKIAFFHFSIHHYCQGRQKRIERLGKKFRAYDKVVMVSEAMRAEAETLFPSMREKFAVIYNPQDLEEIQRRAAEYQVNAKPYILSVARLEESQKDYTTLLKAYKIADEKRNGQMPELRIFGKGRDELKLKSLAQSLGLDGKVMFMGHSPNPLPWFLKCDAFVLSSKFEGLPVVLVEALVLSRPIVVTDCPVGPAEVLDNGGCGILVPVGDIDAMADALVKISTDKEFVQRCIDNGKVHTQKFVWEASSQKFNALARELLNS